MKLCCVSTQTIIAKGLQTDVINRESYRTATEREVFAVVGGIARRIIFMVICGAGREGWPYDDHTVMPFMVTWVAVG